MSKRVSVVGVAVILSLVMGTATLAQGTVEGTYWLPTHWTIETGGTVTKIPAKGFSVSGSYLFNDKLGIYLDHSRLFDAGRIELGEGGTIDADVKASSTHVGIGYSFYSDGKFSIYPTVGYLASLTNIDYADTTPDDTVDASGLTVGLKGSVAISENISGYVKGSYIPSLSLKVAKSPGGTENLDGTGAMFDGGVRYAVKPDGNLLINGGYRYSSMSTKAGSPAEWRNTTSGPYIGITYRF